MLDWLRFGTRDASRPRGVLEVGWINRAEKATLMWDDPRPFRRGDIQEPQSSKALQNCPAVLDFEARHFLVTCPIDLNIGLTRDREGRLALRNLDGAQSAVAAKELGQLVHLNGPGQWRHPDRPLVQITTPYFFVADEVCWMNQLPPFLSYRDPPWPGVMVGGRLPVHLWPRAMMWAFEWHDVARPLQLRRGEPWFLLRFETQDPARRVRLVEAEWTPDLAAFARGTEAVTNFQRQTWALFKTAARRRPEKLLKKVERRASAFAVEAAEE
jgi:hypothetical protein